LLKSLQIFILVISSIVFTTVFGQGLETVRLEVPTDIDAESYHVEPLGAKGVLIFYESNELSKEKKRKWYFGYFDTSLKQQWLKFVALENKMHFEYSTFVNNKLHLLFRNIGKGRNENGFYEIVSLDLTRGSFEVISGTFPSKAEIVGFEVIGNNACLGINIGKSETDLLFVNLDNGDITPVKLADSYESFIEVVYANKTERKFYVTLKVKQDKRYIKDFIHILTAEGKSLEVVEIIKDNNIKILRKFRFIEMSENHTAVLGIYDIQTGKISDFTDLNDEDNPKTAGLFFFKLKNNIVGEIKYLDFMDLDNIHGSIGERKVTKVRTDDQSIENSGGKKIVNAFFNVNKPQVLYDGEKFIFSAEIYKPYYITETRMDYDFYGRPYPYTYSVFAGYLFFDVIVVSLTNDGNLIWNNDFIIRDLKSFSLRRHTVIFKNDHFVTAAYVNDGKIYSKIFEGNLDIDSDETGIATNFNKDRVVEDENNHIIKWYDKYFLIYGNQKIKNRSLSKQNERTIFFINKIAYN